MLSSAAMEVEGSCGEEIAIKQCDSQMEISKSCRVLGSEEKKKWRSNAQQRSMIDLQMIDL